jgi:hypothetical protein
MSGIRRHIAWIASVWLMCQCAAFAAPAAVCCMDRAPSQVPATHSCCTNGNGPCPMHRPTAERACAMKGACQQADAALLSLAGGLGILPPVTPIPLDAHLVAAALVSSHPLVDRATSPTSPPPRS